MSEHQYTPVDIRWQCPRGHFVADSSIVCTDHLDTFGQYYGVASDWTYECRGCGKTYDEEPRIVVVRDSDEPPPEELRCWRTTEEGRQWQAEVQAFLDHADASLAPALRALNREAGDSIEERRQG